MDHIERTILHKVNRIIMISGRLYPVSKNHHIQVMIKRLPNDIAGLANFQTNTVYLDRTSCEVNLSVMVNEVVPHEIAHLVQYFVYPNARYAHGQEWKEICTALGGIPRRMVTI